MTINELTKAYPRSRELLQRVKQVVQSLLPDAKVVLYGSRARGDAAPDSDWDFLVFTDEPVSFDIEQQLWHRLYEVEIDLGEVVSAFIKNRAEWEIPFAQASPYHQSVEKEGMVVLVQRELESLPVSD